MLNKAMLIGHVGQTPDIRVTSNGNQIASFSLATSEQWKDKDGQKRERTQWHKVVVFNESLANLVKSYVKKGSKIYVEGQVETRKWTNNEGRDQYVTEIVLRQFGSRIDLLDKAGEGGPPPPSSENDYGSSRQSTNQPTDSSIIDDEIPW